MEQQVGASISQPEKRVGQLEATTEPGAYAKVITAVATHLINLAPDDIDSGINQVLSILGQYTQADRAILLLQQNSRIYESYEWCSPDLSPISRNSPDALILEHIPWLTALLRRQPYIHIPHIDHLPAQAQHEYDLMRQYNTRSFIAIRLGSSQTQLGFLTLATNSNERTWSQEEISLLQIVAEVFTNALQRKVVEQREMLAYQIGARLATLLEKDALLNYVSEQLRDSFGYYHTQIFLTNALLTADEETQTSHLIVQASAGIIGDQLKERGHTIALDASRSIVARAARTLKPLIVNDVRQAPYHLPNPILPDTCSEVAIPLINEETLIGVLDVQHVERDHFDENEVRTLQIVANQLSTALARSALFARNQRLLAELRLLQSIAQVANEAHDENSLIENVTQIVAPALHADIFGFSLIHPATGHRTDHPSCLYRDHQPQMSVYGPDEGIGSLVARSGHPWRVGDVRREPAFSGDTRTRSVLCVPIILERQVIGVINAESQQPDAFNLADERLLLTIAGQMATTLAKLRHFREARNQAAETSALLATSKAISALDLDHVLKTIVTEARTLFKVDSSHIHLTDPDGETLRCVVAVPEEEEKALMNFFLAVGVGITGYVALSGVPEIVANTLHDPRGVQVPGTPEEDEALALAPLIIRQQVIGVMTITRRDTTNPFTQSNLRLLTAFADMAAVAIDNARLFVAEKRRLEELMLLNEAANISASATTEADLLERFASLLQRVLPVEAVEVVLTGDEAASVLATDSSRWARIAAPVQIGEQVVAELRAARHSPEKFGASDKQLLQTFARQLATGLEKVRLIASEKQRAWRQQKLAETASALLGVRELHELGPVITAVAQQALATQRTAIYIYNPEHETVHCLYAHNLSQMYVDAVAQNYRHSPGAQLLQNVAYVVVDDALHDPRSAFFHDLIREEGIRSFASFALTTPDTLLGALLFYRDRVAPFTEDDISTGQTLAYILSMAYQNVKLLQEIRHALNREQRLNEISRTLNSAPDLPSLLAYVLRTSTDIVGADAGLIGLVLDHQTIIFYPYNIPPSVNLRPATRGSGIAWEIVENGRSILQAPYAEHPKAEPIFARAGANALIGVPITAGEECLGAIQLFSFTPGKQFSRRDLELSESIGRQAGVALQNGRLIKDLSERAEALAQALARQEELDQAKNEFIQNVSHELRTPLGLVLGYAELLESGDLGELNPAQKQSMSIILKRTQMLITLLEDMSVLLAAETQEFRRENINTKEFLLTLQREFEIQAEKAKIQLTLTLEGNLPEILGDPFHLRRVFDNLLSNAFKFTPMGGTISLKAWMENRDVVIEVSDTGTGIDNNEMQRIFERFYRAKAHSAQHHKGRGTGLGLALVKEIIEAHRGKITVRSKPGKGTTFQIRFATNQAE